MRHDKVKAAIRLADALISDDDFIFYLMDHPNTERVVERLRRDIDSGDNLDNILSTEGGKENVDV